MARRTKGDIQDPTEIGRLLWFEWNDRVADDLISTVDIAENFNDATIADIDLWRRVAIHREDLRQSFYVHCPTDVRQCVAYHSFPNRSHCPMDGPSRLCSSEFLGSTQNKRAHYLADRTDEAHRFLAKLLNHRTVDTIMMRHI